MGNQACGGLHAQRRNDVIEIHATVWKRRPPSENAWRDFLRACHLVKVSTGRASKAGRGAAELAETERAPCEPGWRLWTWGRWSKVSRVIGLGSTFGPELEEGSRAGMLPSFTAGTMAAEFVVRRLGWPQQSWGVRAPPSHVLWPLFAHSDSQLRQMMPRG